MHRSLSDIHAPAEWMHIGQMREETDGEIDREEGMIHTIETRQGTCKLSKTFACRSSVFRKQLETNQPLRLFCRAEVMDLFLDFLSDRVEGFAEGTSMDVQKQVLDLFEEFDVDGERVEEYYLKTMRTGQSTEHAERFPLGWKLKPSKEACIAFYRLQARHYPIAEKDVYGRYIIVVDASKERIEEVLRPYRINSVTFEAIPTEVAPTTSVLLFCGRVLATNGNTPHVRGGNNLFLTREAHPKDECCIVL